MKKILGLIRTTQYLWSLLFSTIVYFAAVRVFQDWLYHRQGLTVRPADLFDSFGPLFMRPEPFEIIFYVLGYAIVPILAYFFMPLMGILGKYKKHLLITGGVVAVLGALIALPKLPWERFITYFQTRELAHILWFVTTKRIIVAVTVVIASTLFAVWYYLTQSTKKLWLQKKSVEHFFKRFWPAGLAALIILMFNPSFPIDVHHYNYFVGIVSDIYNGKGILYETSHLYGLFNVYFMTALFKLVPLTYPNFALLIMTAFTVFFAAVWTFLRKWLNSYTFATLGTAVVMAIIYFFQTSPTRSALFLPGMSPFRWGLYVPVLFLMLAYQNTKKNVYLYWSYFVAAFALFWNFDSGAFLVAAVLLTTAYIKLQDKWDIKGVIIEWFKFGVNVAGIFLITNVVNKVIYGTWPQWSLFFKESKYFSQGIAMYPLPLIGIYEIIFFVYVSLSVFALYRLVARKSIDIPLVFLTLFGIFSFVYYIGESSWQILYVITAPFIMVALYVSYTALQHITLRKYHRVARTSLMTILFFGAALLAFKLPTEFAARDYSEFKNKLTVIQPEEQGTYNDALHIKEHYPQERIAVMSSNDTKLFLYSEKVNYYDFYYIFTIYFRPEMQQYVDQTVAEKPNVVFVGTGDWHNDQVEYFTQGILSEYTKKESLETLDVYVPIEE